MKQFHKLILFLCCAVTLSVSSMAQDHFFTDASANKLAAASGNRVIIPEKFRAVEANTAQLKAFLWSLPSEKNINLSRNQTPVFEVPMPDGSFAKFHVWESSIQEPALEAKFPGIRTFAGQGIDDPYATIRFDFTPRGFHAQVLSVNGTYYIDPYALGNTDYYISYFRKDMAPESRFVCDVQDPAPGTGRPESITAACRGTDLRTYRLAVACTGEYAQAPGVAAGANPALLHAAIVTTVNRVVGVYETEVALRMVLVANNDLVEFLNAGSDPFNGNNNANTLINESQTVITGAIGTANFDIGHTFSTGGGGLAGLGVVCQASQKGRGITGSPTPTGDGYDIDYVAHEMGHQWGGNHSMAGCGSSPNGTKYEVGSGTTIQAYAGICGGEDIQPHSDPTFHAISFDEISNYVSGTGGTCGTTAATGNILPVIDPLPNNNLSIPVGTPFTLTGSATDANGDALTYCWEEWDFSGTATWNAGATAAAGNTVPLFKSRLPKTTGSRTFPDMAVILANYPPNPPAIMNGLKGETLSPVARPMKFRLTVRDNRAAGGGIVSSGSGCQDATVFQVNVTGTAPFVVTAPNGGESYPGNTSQTVTWNVVGTNAAPVNTANVKISLSTDGGLTYPTVLLASTANDGSEAVVMPNTPTTTARVKVEALANIFFDISNANFTITAAVSGFTFNTTTPTVVVCPAPATATVNLGTTAVGTFSTPIVLSATAGVPAGTTVSFSPNPLTPGNATTVTLNNANTLANGTYNITVQGVAGAVTQTTTVTFTVSAGAGPVITTQPAAVTVCEGLPASFTVAATGATGYQWQVNSGAGFTNIAAATAATLNIAATTIAQNGNIYHCVVTGQCGTTTSNDATLTVQATTVIVTPPANTTVCVGTDATFTVVATGTNLTYQWQVSTDGCITFSNIVLATSSSYTVTGVTAAMNDYRYKVIVTGTCGTASSNNCASLTVGNAAAITGQPVNTTVCEGQNAVFTVTGSGTISSYQWQVNTGTGFTDIPGATSPTLTLNAVTVSMSGYQYQVNVFSCTAIPITSSTATLTVNSLATISAQPADVTLCLGANASFAVTAAGTGITYQWQYAATCAGPWTNIAGETNATLNINAVTLANAGAYHVVVTGTCNPVTSNCATLVVNSPITISAQPVDANVCLPTNTASFSVTAAGTGLTYQWQVSTDAGATFTNLAGETNATLNLTGLTAAMNGNQYHVVLNGTCTTNLNSVNATLAVNSPVDITSQPTDISACAGSTATFAVAATGSTISYQWQVSINGGPFVNVSNAAPFSGATTNTLTVNPITTSLDGYEFRVIVSGVPCGSVTSNTVTLTANALPVVVLTAASYTNITPYIRTTLYTTVSPAGNYSYQWFRDGVAVPSLNNLDKFAVTVDDFGDYDVIVTDNSTNCSSNRSNKASVDYKESDQLFIYPNPTSGSFQVRYFSSTTTARTLNIYDSKGARVYTQAYPISSPYTRMDVNMDNAASGVYMVELKDANGKRIKTSKVVIR